VVLTLIVSVSGQQKPAASPTSAPQAGSRVTGNLEHGRYLVEQVIQCWQCHSSRDAQGNLIVGTKFRGGAMAVRPTFTADWPNQIPRIAGLPGYDDDQAMRLLTQGAIRWDGRQLRPPMPPFRMSPQDAADVIAYLRSL
jgi:mono/diheme cytochrome c family protein